MEGAYNGHFCTGYTLHIDHVSAREQTELSAIGHSGAEVCISGTGTCITHVKLEHEATSSKRGGNDNYGAASIFHPRPANAGRKPPPLAMNEVMDTAKGTRIENLQPARNQVVACACVSGVISHNLLG